MRLFLNAACGCNTGKIRKNNEDNFCFDGRCLDADNDGLEQAIVYASSIRKITSFAIFDGMGGASFGEQASYVAANCMRNKSQRYLSIFDSPRRFLCNLCEEMNEAVLDKQKDLLAPYMGSTAVVLLFAHYHAFICNLGDSRAYLFRNGELVQVSKDHIEKRLARDGRKAPLTQHLGIPKETFIIEPYIDSENVRCGDRFLLCSDGLTDMLTDKEIGDILTDSCSPKESVDRLIEEALDKGGKDNISVIVCLIQEKL